MEKPTLRGFHISEADLSDAKRVRKSLIISAIIWAVIGLAVSAEVGKQVGPLILLMIPPFGPIAFYFAAKAVIRRLRPTFGRVLEYETALSRYEQWWIRTQAEFWRSLSGRAFEVELANLYRRLGFEAHVTRRDDDKGVDIWIVRDGHRIPIQCKAHRRPVTPGAARELYGTMQHFGAPAGILASISGFTTGVANYALGKRIELLDLSAVLELQRRVDSGA